MMKVGIFGCGYVGLVTATGLAKLGHHVVCVDIDDQRIETLKLGQIPLFEPELQPMLIQQCQNNRIMFSHNLADAVCGQAIIFITVCTPPTKDGLLDIRAVIAAVHSIGPYLENNTTLVIKSTVPVGTTDMVKQIIESYASNKCIQFNIASNPEFLQEGCALENFFHPDRIIIGASHEQAIKTLKKLYQALALPEEKIIVMEIKDAEFSKFAANAMLATRISFMNELSHITEALGVNIHAVKLAIGSDPRIGKYFLEPGCGFGGSCLPKDMNALIQMSLAHHYDPKLLHAVVALNHMQFTVMIQKLNHYFNTQLAGKSIAIWGLAFKANTDDIRESPSCFLIDYLLQHGAKINAYDPKAMEKIKAKYPDQGQVQKVL